MRFLPTTRGGTLWRAFLACFLIVGFAAAATAVAGLLQVSNLAVELGHNAQAIKGLTLPAPGKPETILLIGSDHRAGQGSAASYANANTDTMLLIRIDDSSQTINVMSVPRDLEVLGPGGTPVKLNSIYSTEGGPAGLIKQLKAQVFPQMQVNHVIDTNFTGFSNLIDAIGCVYVDVDHRYYNVSQPAPSPDNFSSIDIQPGYQKLCGGVHSVTGTNSALAFVRFRHTDSDEVRNARQQDFIRWAKDGYSTSDLLNNRDRLIRIFSRYTQPDKSLATTDGLLNLANLVIDANSHTLRTIRFPEYFGACTSGSQTPCYVYPCPQLSTCSGYGGPNPPIGQPTQATEATWRRFITPTVAKVAPVTKTAPSRPRRRASGAVSLAGLTADPGDGASQAAQLGNVGFPVMYPKDIVAGQAGVTSGYCFSLTENCDPTALEPVSAYAHSYPRRYEVAGHKAYVMTLVINSNLGEYYTVEGTTWKTPPILNHPAKVLHYHGRELWEYDDGSKLADVAIKTGSAVYWISNTLNNVIPNSEMLGMAATMTVSHKR